MDDKDFFPGNFDTSLFSEYEEVAEDILAVTRYRDLDEDSRQKLYENLDPEKKWRDAFTEYNKQGDASFLTPEEWVSYIDERMNSVEEVSTGRDDWDGEEALPEPKISSGGEHVSLRAFVEGNYVSGFHYHGPLFKDELEEGEFPESPEEAVDLDDLDTSTGDLDPGFTAYVEKKLGRLPANKTELVRELHKKYSDNHSFRERLTRKQFAEQLEEFFDIDLNYEPSKGELHRTVPANKDLLPVPVQENRWPME